MIAALLHNLGVILSASLGLGPLSSGPAPTPPILLPGREIPAQLHAATDHAIAIMSTCEAVTEAESEEEEDEAAADELVTPASILKMIGRGDCLESWAPSSFAGDGPLHQLHRSWQLRC